MKYRFQLSPAVRNICEWQLSAYREEKKQLETMKTDLIHFPIGNYGEIPSGRTAVDARPTEKTTMLICSVPYLRRMENGCSAVERALAFANPETRKLIQLVYWEKRFSVEGAALMVHLSKSAAYRHLNVVLGVIAYELGFVKSL